MSHSRISAKYEYVTLSTNKIEIEMLSFEVFIDRYSGNFVLIVHYDLKEISPIHTNFCFSCNNCAVSGSSNPVQF